MNCKYLKQALTLCLMLLPLGLPAQNWDHITTSGEYYYGTGHGATEAEATKAAMAELAGMIATHVSSEFTELTNETKINGKDEHHTRVEMCVNSYAQATLTNTEKWVTGEEPDVTVRCYMKRSELSKIYEGRINKAKDMIDIARGALQKGKIDFALQYYYWAYSLIRSVQRPNDVRDDEGRILVNWLPMKIDEILAGITITYEKSVGDEVDMLFSYNDQPVSSLNFTYSDGRAVCEGRAADGRGTLLMIPNYNTPVYHVDIDYEYKGQARGDAEMSTVLKVIDKKVFQRAERTVEAKSDAKPQDNAEKLTAETAGESKAGTALPAEDKTGIDLKPAPALVAQDTEACDKVLDKVLESIHTKNYSSALNCFTLEGLEMYNELISYGTGRIVGQPRITYFKSANGRTVARGMQMAFSFRSGTKKTFVEDVVFTFNPENKIENVAFGLGQVAENDILCKYAPGWNDETREMLMEFMENYKTVYCLKRLDYIRNIFADDAVIIIGNVARKNVAKTPDRRSISLGGQQVINYNRYNKDEYLKNLERCFRRNEFINIRFTNNDIQWLEKYEGEEQFAIQIGQEYNSSTYGDKGFLFLLVDMTDHDAPQIKIRTWQPNEVAMEKLYNAGDFYSE